ncbi:MAG: hypothetical protein R2765_04460 [Ferruginibacter sp.]
MKRQGFGWSCVMEAGGRSVIPFNGMLAGDAWLWSKYRDDEELMRKFKRIYRRTIWKITWLLW